MIAAVQIDAASWLKPTTWFSMLQIRESNQHRSVRILDEVFCIPSAHEPTDIFAFRRLADLREVSMASESQTVQTALEDLIWRFFLT
jgi:hypothetical protein